MINDKLRDEKNRFRRALESGADNTSILTDLYWTAFSRPPTEEEQSKTLQFLAQIEDRVLGWEDVVWTLVNRKEFLFQH